MVITRILFNNFTHLKENLQLRKEEFKTTKNSLSLNKSFLKLLYFFSNKIDQVEYTIRDDTQPEYDR